MDDCDENTEKRRYKMKKLYKIEIKETISDIVEVEAESSSEAEYEAGEEYYNGKHILDGVYPQNRELICKDISSPFYISQKRKEEIFNRLFEYVFEHCKDEKDYYNALKNIIGLTDSEMTTLGIEVTRQVTAVESLKENEVIFEDEIMFENDNKINAYIPLYYINIFEKFNIHENVDTEYNMYLNYDTERDKSTIIIIEKQDKGYIEYQYETSESENDILKEKLNNYCIEMYGHTINRVDSLKIENDKIDEINLLFNTENKEKVVKSMEYNFFAIESMEDVNLIDANYFKEKDIDKRFSILKEIFINKYDEFIEYFEDIPKNVKDDISEEKKIISRINNKEETFSQYEMDRGITYMLQDGRFFQFYKAENGFSFTLFDENGRVEDGGLKLYKAFEVELSYLPKNYILEELSKMISPSYNLKIIKDKEHIRLENGLTDEAIRELRNSKLIKKQTIENEII